MGHKFRLIYLHNLKTALKLSEDCKGVEDRHKKKSVLSACYALRN